MCGIETRFRAVEDADSIMATFYAFVEEHGGDVDGDAHLRTEFDGAASSLLVRLWSPEAMQAFLQSLSSRMRTRPKTVYE